MTLEEATTRMKAIIQKFTTETYYGGFVQYRIGKCMTPWCLITKKDGRYIEITAETLEELEAEVEATINPPPLVNMQEVQRDE